VSVDKLTSQLRRDLAANPKKAAVLGLMVLVALYFWGPLVLKFVQAGGTKQKKTNVSALILTDDPIEPSQQPGKTGLRSRFRWEKVRQQIDGDERMRSAEFDIAWVDPFGAPAPAAAQAEQVAEQPMEDPAALTSAVAAIDPQSVGLSLGGILLGSGRRLAIVNGQICRQGDVVSILDKRDKSTTYEFHVHSIRGQSVQLEIGGQIFSLELNQPRLAHGDDVKRGKPTERD
jgi:hypothetical protein